MAKTLGSKNKKPESDEVTHVEKKSKKKSKAVEQNDEEQVVESKVKQKRKKNKEEPVEEVPVKKAKTDEESIEDVDEDVAELHEEGKIRKIIKKSGEKGPSKRELKRKRLEEKNAQIKLASKQEAMDKALNYVSMLNFFSTLLHLTEILVQQWKHAKSQWKFEKLKQIWLMDNLLDQECVPDSVFPTVLEYFEGCKGMARETLYKKGVEVIKKYEQNQEKEDETDEVVETVEYKRARELLQALPTES
ncbi:GSCOCG00000194001-RA-CDS [Cotesia congregata]|nr:GSCOCG00000194001-RA-CDS [Cotesia congregata]